MSEPQPRMPQLVWLDGRFVSIERASISPLDRGFQYGDGVFETLRAEHGRILMLDEHLERLYRSLEALRIRLDVALPWPAVLAELIEKNGLDRRIASIKVLVSRGIQEGLGCPSGDRPTVLALARPYAPPSPAAYDSGWRLIIHRDGFAPPLARFKSLNYLFFLMARQAAWDAGADEAVVLDPSGFVTETSAGSILARTASHWWTPSCPFQLPGITLQGVTRLLREDGHSVERKPATPSDLTAAETVWVLNSLMGIMPAREIDGRELADRAADEAAALRERLWSAGS